MEVSVESIVAVSVCLYHTMWMEVLSSEMIQNLLIHAPSPANSCTRLFATAVFIAVQKSPSLRRVAEDALSRWRWVLYGRQREGLGMLLLYLCCAAGVAHVSDLPKCTLLCVDEAQGVQNDDQVTIGIPAWMDFHEATSYLRGRLQSGGSEHHDGLWGIETMSVQTSLWRNLLRWDILFHLGRHSQCSLPFLSNICIPGI
mmetsp:Transcript_8438/g.31230  ORF Transcript_8438/g.31230 Transcript_8438/m.31230 type:complete len:200 (+) Transcript_8438:277-876(+)